MVDKTKCWPSRRRMYWCHVPEITGVWAPAIHSDCIHNEYTSLAMRTLGQTPADPGSRTINLITKELRNQIRKMNIDRMSRDEVIRGYKGRLYKRYSEAKVSLDQEGELTKHDKTLKSFLKAEKFNPLLKPSKPRMINARSPRYNLELATYLKPIEHALWKRLKGGSTRRSRAVGKGLNHYQRADLIGRKMEEIGDGCVVFEVDGKAWEAHVLQSDLRREHSVYRAAFPGDRHLSTMLDVQLNLAGKTTNGIRFFRPGCRASGDFNTGLGNTLLMYIVIVAAFRELTTIYGNFKWDMLADGDNCLVFIEGRLASKIHARFAEVVSTVSAQELAVEKPTTILEEVVFGQSNPVCVDGRYRMVRHPFKILSGAFSSYRHYDHLQIKRGMVTTKYSTGIRVLKAVAQCELYMASGLPVLQSYFSSALQQLQAVPDLVDPTDFMEGRYLEVLAHSSWSEIRQTKLVDVVETTRHSFYLAFGIEPERQVAMEEKLSDVKFPFMDPSWQGWGDVLVTDGVDGDGPEASLAQFLGWLH